MRTGWPILLATLMLAATTLRASAAEKGVAELFEDGAEALLKQMTNPGGDTGGQGSADNQDVFSGTTSIRIGDYQRYTPKLEGWHYRIREKPHAGEYRYLRLAWKKTGAPGIMIQFHDEKDWNIRYVAGANPLNWTATSVADAPPEQWTVLTRDLFQDFGERTLTGMALTSFAGEAHFDHIYLGQTIADLDHIDVTGLRKPGQSMPLPAAKLQSLWHDLASDNAAHVYRATWTLAAGPADAVPFLKGRFPTAAAQSGATPEQFRQWIAELDHDRFVVRERAMKELKQQLTVAVPLLQKEREKAQVSAESARRIDQLLKQAELASAGERRQLTNAIRVLEVMETAEARTLLESLSQRGPELEWAQQAQLALERLSQRKK